MLEQLLLSQHAAADWFLKYQLALIYMDRNRIAESKKLFMDCGNDPAYAPFYATLSEMFRDGDSAQSLADLQKALSLDKGQWRYYKLLAFVGKAEMWPENLGSGKPYDRDIDSRMEDWMKYICFRKLGRSDSAAARLHSIEAAGSATDKAIKTVAAGEGVNDYRPGSGNSTATVNNRLLHQLIPVQAKL